jgi:hypothetical protein
MTTLKTLALMMILAAVVAILMMMIFSKTCLRLLLQE